MHGLFSVLSMAVRPYTISYMVAGGVGDPLDDLNKSSRPLTRLEAIAPDGNDIFFITDNITTDAIHCNTDNYDHGASPRVVPNEKRQPKGYTATHTTQNSRASSASINSSQPTSTTIPAKSLPTSMRLRGGNGESDVQLKALVDLSCDGNALFKRLIRKCLLLTYNEGRSISDILDTYSLTGINEEIDDVQVTDATWYTYGATLSWADVYEYWNDEIENNYEDEYEDDDDDVYYDADEWSEGDILVGALTYWNYERNYGIIVVLDDYSHDSADGTSYDTTSGEIFCHGSYFIDGDSCDLEPGDLVWFTVTWDTERDRWHAINIKQASKDELFAFAEGNGMDEVAAYQWFEHHGGQQYDGP